MKTIRSSRPSSRLLGSLLFAAALMALAPGVALAKTDAQAKTSASCGKQVVADWYDDGRIGKIYPLHCYTDAIASLPSDVRDYSSAKEEITRALSYAKVGKTDPGKNGTSVPPTSTTPSTTGTTTTTKTTTAKTSTTKTTTGKVDTTPIGTFPMDTNPIDTGAVSPTDTSGPSSVPVPLIVLGALAVILLAAGSAGYLRRRAGNRSDDGMPPGSA